jgi:hypothetical protein
MSNEASTPLWRFNPVTGIWVHERTCFEETQQQWLDQFRRDEPGVHFVLSRRKPTHTPSKEAACF